VVRRAVPAVLLTGVLAGLAVGDSGLRAQVPAAPIAPAAGPDSPRAVLDTYCVTCHNARTLAGGLALDEVDPAAVAGHEATWERVVRRVKVGMMPPQGMPQPSPEVRAAFVTAMEGALDGAAGPFPGRASFRRLNRAEYANAIRDLLALDIDPADYLPPDELVYGFDNIGDALALSTSLLESYSAAAARIATLAIGDAADVVPASSVYRTEADLSQSERNAGLPLGTAGGLLIRQAVPVDGEYEIAATLFKTNLGLMRGLEFPREMHFLVDGVLVHSLTVGGKESYEAMLQNQTEHAIALEAEMKARVPLAAGVREIGVTFAQRAEVLNTMRLQVFERSTSDTSQTLYGPPHVQTVTITGPLAITGVAETPSRRAIFTCTPATVADEGPCAREILSRLARRAYRGTDTPADVDELMRFFEAGRASSDLAGGGFERGVGFALERLLTGPRFLVRMEPDPALAPGTIRDVTPVELASRLSFFLWSTIPDDVLLDAALDGRLDEADEVALQVRRMLADPKAGAFVANFAGQWLQLRNLANTFPDSRVFPDFDDQLRQAFRRETELLVESVVREDRSVLDLLTADYTFVNGRLARHYGIPGVAGDAFRRVAVTDEARRGLLGHGSILTVTSHSTRTSPVRRGKWVLENLLGAPPPPPPPNVPALEESAALADRPLTVREQMERHRANPVCASCHRMMDPIGFALENFDGTGAWRVRDARAAVDSAGALFGGAVSGPGELRAAVLRQPENFVTTLTEKLLIYALGRGIDHRDMPTVRAIVRAAGGDDYRFSSLVLGIVNSAPFTTRIVLPPQAPDGLQAAAPAL
jgi:mono/diheme cytochrome c family protein